jgi:hypothetical protein
LTISSAQLANAGDYRVIITNSVSAVTSRRHRAWQPGHRRLGTNDQPHCLGAVWDFHASAFFEPEVFDEDWFACDFVPSFWWPGPRSVMRLPPAAPARGSQT